MLAFQARRLADLRAFAVERSPFYRDLHQGLDRAPLSDLPVVTKATLMERFDDLVTDREVHLADVEAFSSTASATDRFRDHYRVAATGGTTGRRGIFLADPHEWTQVLASYGRAYEWAGVAAGVANRIRMAVVSSTNPTHQSSIVGATVASRFIPTIRLDASQPIEDVVVALNHFRPDSLVGYASILRTLAGRAGGWAAARDPARGDECLGGADRRHAGADRLPSACRPPTSMPPPRPRASPLSAGSVTSSLRGSGDRRSRGRGRPAGARGRVQRQDPGHRSLLSDPAPDPL